MKSNLPLYVGTATGVVLLLVFLTGCQEKTDLDKGHECIEEQKKKFGKDYSPGDAGPCISKYWLPKETNPYLK
jgi:hypothetical protein